MFFAKYINNNQEHSELYHSWEQYHRDTWNPLAERIHLIDFRISGTDYKSRKKPSATLLLNGPTVTHPGCL